MTHLNIQQGLNIEVVSTNLIKKLYEAALSVPEPLPGEEDAAYMSGNLLVDKSYRSLVEYLTNRFDDLHINVTAGYYMLFHDSAVNDVLKNTIGDGEGVLLNEFQAITNDSQLGLGSSATAHPEITDFREACLLTGLTLFTSGFPALTGLTLFGFPPNIINYPRDVFANNTRLSGAVVKNLNNFINRNGTIIWWINGYYLYDMDNNGNLTRIDTLTIPSSISFPNGVNKDCLCGVKLEEIIIPSSCTYITSLSGPYLKKISFESPSSLTTIEANTFWYGPSWLNSIVQLDLANLPQTITTIGSNAFRSCSNVTGVLDLPNLTSLGQYAFYAAGITSITDLGSVTSIPQNCFLYSALQSITLPSTCTTINSRGLSDMTALTTVSGGSGLTTIGGYAFYNDTNLTSVAGLSNVTSIGESAFWKCSSLTGTLNLPNLVSLGNGAFHLTNITNVLNLGLVSEINDPFWNCPSITEIVLPTTLRKSGFFYNTHISKLIFPYGYTELTASSMCGNQLGRYLLYIQFPSTITKIVLEDMYRDSGSSKITCHVVILATTPPNTNRNPSNTGGAGLGWGWGEPNHARWYVPDSAVNDYKASDQWSSIADYIFPISQLEADSPTCWAWYQANKDYGVPAQS